MKLRIRSNTLRFRLTQKEIAALIGGGQVEERISFGPKPSDKFIYSIVPSDSTEGIDLRYVPGHITLLLSRTLCRQLDESNEDGLRQKVEVGEGVSVLIEKDFICLKPRDPAEDEGAFPHPDAVR